MSTKEALEKLAALGFVREETGGGCTALIQRLPDDTAIYLTDGEMTAPLDFTTFDDPVEMVAYRNDSMGEPDSFAEYTFANCAEVIAHFSQRFVWLIGSIREGYPDIPESAEPNDGTLVLWDRLHGQPVVTVAAAYANAICLEHTEHGTPFTTLADWLNDLSKDELDSENLPS